MPDTPAIDYAIYGGYDSTAVPASAAAASNPAKPVSVAQPAVPIASVVEGNPLLTQSEAVRQNNMREDAPFMASVGAGISQWTVARGYKALNEPHFESKPGFSAATEVAKTNFTLSMEQEKFLLAAGDKPDLYAYRLQNIEDQNEANAAMGDNKMGALLGMVADPGYLGISLASFGAGNVARIGGATRAGQRVAAGVTGFGAAVGLGKLEQQVVPLSDAHVYGVAALFGAAEALIFRGGKMQAVDPTAPTARLTELAEQIARRDEGTPLAAGADDFVGEVTATSNNVGDNLTRSRVAPTGEGANPVSYKGGTTGGEYNPAMNLSRSEQKAIEADGVIRVNTVDDIAEHAPSVAAGRTVIDRDAKAVYLPAEDRVFLIEANIKAGDDVKGIMLHEVGVHMNAERVLGVERMGRMMDKLEDMALAGNSRAKAAYESVPKNTPLHLVREEALGYYVEANHRLFSDGIVRRFVHGVKETLRRVGMRGLKLSENDIMQLVRKSAKGKKAASFDTAFPYAWHGSPTRGIDQLDTAYMGSGEGAQAFGHGHYLTSEKGTALDYRNKEALRRNINPEDAGLYRVKINAKEHQFIDLDGRVQSATVQAAFEKLGVRPGVTGKTAYDHLAKTLGGQKQASEALVAEGVAGNKYATGRTRHSGDKSSNYVIFHNDAVDMAARYSKGAPPGASLAEKAAHKLEISLHKTLSSFSDEAKKVADFLVDDPLNMAGNSVANQQRAIRADLAHLQFKVEDDIFEAMAAQGFGTLNQVKKTEQAITAQRAIERDVFAELTRRNQLSVEGKPITTAGVPEHIDKIATKWEASMELALQEQVRAGVDGAAQIAAHRGYVPRAWDNVRIESVQAKLVEGGMTEAAAREAVIDSLGIGMQRANGFDAVLARDIATATLDRARRKGYFEDSAMRRHQGEDTIAEVRDILEKTNIPVARREKILEIMTGKADEAGKAPSLKHRVQVSLDEPIGNTGSTLMDLLDTSLVSIGERYLDRASSNAAFARKGMTKASDVAAMRKTMLESIPNQTARGEAAAMFDNTIAALRGDPVGEEMHKIMRMSKGLTQMLGLSRAGLFQMTEYSTLMADHGATAVMKEVFRELPFVRGMLSDVKEAGHLRNVLARNSSEDIRIRPFVSKMEDNWAIPAGDTAQLAIMQAKQLVPYLNGLKYVQGHQARVSANLAVNTFERAAKGDIKALAALENYGLESHIMGQIRNDIATHGMDTVKWSDDTWDAVRGPLTKMMDDSVLRARTGEIPAFAQFSTTGRFIFTFRSFVLGAHNKVLAGTLNRKGFHGLGLILMHQLPLTYMIMEASNTMSGKPPLTGKQAFGQALGNAGSLGLLSEAVGVAFGQKEQFGAPGLIAIDRGYKLLGAAAKGDVEATGAAAYNAVPLLSVIPVLKGIPEVINPTH